MLRNSSRTAARPAGGVAGVLLAVSLIAGCGGGADSVTSTASTGPAGVASATASPTVGRSGGGAASGSAPAPLPRSVPVRLKIPSIGVDTPVISLGLASDGTVQVPPIEAHAPAGWYRGSPTPGQLGPSVFLGHVTVGRYGNGVFLRLSQLKRGARVVARLADGDSAAFTVDSVRTVAKDRFPTRAVYGDTNRPELRLVTCGGPRTSTGYRDNVIVFASLVDTVRAGHTG